MPNDSLDFFLRLINEKQNRLKSLSNSLLRTLASDSDHDKRIAASALLASANELKSIISTKDMPSWLNDLITKLAHYIEKRWAAPDLLENYLSTKSLLDSHVWVFNADTESPFDFDRIYEHYKNESRLPQLFDEIIKILEDIISSGEVDSLSMIKSLGKVIVTLKTNKNGSYFSLNGAWEFLISFLNNYMWAELNKLPVIGTLMEALEKTIKETNEEMFTLHSKIQCEMKDIVENDIKHLKGKATFNFVGYDKTGYVVENNSNNGLISKA